MKNIFLAIVMIITSICFEKSSYPQSNDQPDSLAVQHKRHKHPFPLKIGSIKAGTTKDSAVVKRFGTGIFDPEDGHGGARYYIDSKRQVLLYTVIGVDAIIDEVSISDIAYPFDFLKSIKAYPPNSVSSGFSVNSKTESNLSLGIAEDQITRTMGIPNRVEKDGDLRTLIFEDSDNEWAQVIFYRATFVLKKNKLIRISFYNGE